MKSFAEIQQCTNVIEKLNWIASNPTYNVSVKTRSGQPVNILTTNRIHDYPIVGLVYCDDKQMDEIITWRSNGCVPANLNICEGLDLIVTIKHQAENWPIDSKIMVWNKGDTDKYTRHFAGLCPDTGRIRAWDDGKTSFTANPVEYTQWDNAELVK